MSSASKSKATTSRSGSAASKSSRAPSAASTVSSKASVGGSTSSVKASRAPSETGFKVTKLSSTTVTLQSTWTPKPLSEPSSSTPAPIVESPPTRTTDPLQVASQVYPWTYMSSTLDACFKGAEATSTNDLETRAKELEAQESEISEQLNRLDAERSIEFYDELGSDAFATEAPAIMTLFHSHGDACNRIEIEALKLVSRDAPDPPEEEPLKVYQDMLDDLEQLHAEATSLQNSIIKLTQEPLASTENKTADGDPGSTINADASSARSQVNGIFSACLPVLRARLANLSMAQELIDSALENVSLGLRMESMGLTD
ncbi:hypothetical protein CVT25_015700 [Psilocybe cyanescens]|uniref:Uncharacterized protein n=1 Tax=Psilocybe cyanescens TaxID=93625 RepID=A0A409XPK0_PSICY|nr:hypothetical protein CVT25_015700 [Psilocybe cyanescens]